MQIKIYGSTKLIIDLGLNGKCHGIFTVYNLKERVKIFLEWFEKNWVNYYPIQILTF